MSRTSALQGSSAARRATCNPCAWPGSSRLAPQQPATARGLPLRALLDSGSLPGASTCSTGTTPRARYVLGVSSRTLPPHAPPRNPHQRAELVSDLWPATMLSSHKTTRSASRARVGSGRTALLHAPPRRPLLLALLGSGSPPEAPRYLIRMTLRARHVLGVSSRTLPPHAPPRRPRRRADLGSALWPAAMLNSRTTTPSAPCARPSLRPTASLHMRPQPSLSPSLHSRPLQQQMSHRKRWLLPHLDLQPRPSLVLEVRVRTLLIVTAD